MKEKTITQKWAMSGLLQSTPKSRQKSLASMLELTSSVMQQESTDGRAAVLMFPLIVRLHRNHPELEPILSNEKEVVELIHHLEDVEYHHMGGLANLAKDLIGIDAEAELLSLVERSYAHRKLKQLVDAKKKSSAKA